MDKILQPMNKHILESKSALSICYGEVAKFQIWRFFGKGRANANPRFHKLRRAYLQQEDARFIFFFVQWSTIP